ncbi:MAG: futA1 1 [Dehalococcoidia bacterium]|nr:futA1 1 [Dehalococcoidia bacterium]
MKRVWSYVLSSVLLFTLVLSACAAPQALAPAPEKPSVVSPAPTLPQLTREQQLIEAAKKEGVVNYWTNTSRGMEEALKVFKERYPFLEVKIWDARGPEVAAKITEEAKVGRYSVDLISTAEKDFFPPSLWKEVIADYEWPNTRNWPFLRGHNYYRNFSGSVFGTSYNASLLSAAEAPKTWEELNSTTWRGKAVISVSSNDVPLYFAYVWGEKSKLNWDKSFSFWREVIANARPRTVSGFTGSLEMHAAGEYPLFIMTSLPSAMDYMVRGARLEVAPVSKVYVSHNVLSVIKNAPHPNAARLFADFLTSTEGQFLYNNKKLNLSIDPEAAKRSRGNLEYAKRGIVIDEIPLEFIADEYFKKSNEFWLGLLGRAS